MEKGKIEEFQPLDKEKKKFKDFDEILEVIGGEGKYQKIILYGFLTPLIIISPLFFMNRIFLLSVPDHHCHVPGRPNGTDLESWKNLTLPMEMGPDGQMRYSQCEMYSENGNGSKVQCEQWEFDKTYYESTMSSEFNWVCSQAQRPTDTFTAGSIGNVIGTILFGSAADKWGRKPFFFVTIFLFAFFHTLSLFVPQHFTMFLVFEFLAGTAFPFFFSAPCMIAAELSGKDYRAWIYTVVWIVWVFGNSILPFIAWACRSWFVFGLVTNIPAFLLFAYYKMLPESPRWLVSVGKLDEATKIIKEIARVNGRFIDPTELDDALKSIKRAEQDKKKKNIGVWTLFTKRRLAINTIMLSIAWSMNGLIYYGIALNTTNMSGNEFMNYFLLGIVELPAGYVGGNLVNKTGRRWTQACFFFLSTIAFFGASLTVLSSWGWLTVLLATLVSKFCMSVTSLVVYLQGTELFPTPLRSTGTGLASTVCSIVGTLGPHIVFLGTINVVLPYVLFTILSLIGSLSSACLPETFNMSLPETVEDSNTFGKNQKFWSYLPKEKALIVADEDEKKKPINKT